MSPLLSVNVLRSSDFCGHDDFALEDLDRFAFTYRDSLFINCVAIITLVPFTGE